MPPQSLSPESRGRLIALADDLSVHGSFNPTDAISAAVDALVDGQDTEATVRVAGESLEDPPDYWVMEAKVRQMLDELGIAAPEGSAAGWGIVWRESQKLRNLEERAEAIRAIEGAFAWDARPDEVYYVTLAGDASVGIPVAELERRRIRRSATLVDLSPEFWPTLGELLKAKGAEELRLA